MKIKVINLKYFCIFFLIALLQERLFFQTNISLVFIISISGLIYTILNIKKIINLKYEFKLMIILLLLIEFYGILLSYFKYGQSIITGVVGTHYIFIYGLYFYFVELFSKGNSDENIERLKKIFINIGVIYTVLLIFQKIVYPTIFLKLNFGIRNGLRIQGCQIIQYAFVIAVSDIINDFKWPKLFSIILMGYELLVINQARNVILVFGMIIMFLFYKKVYDKNKIHFLLSLLLIPIILLIAGKFGFFNIIDEVVGETRTIEGTSGVRVNELNYYYDKLEESRFWGIGVLGDGFSQKNNIYGNDIGYYLEDIGISAFIMKTGILGAIWTICWIIKLFKRVNKQNAWIKILALFVAMKTIFSMFFSISFIFDIRDGLIYFIIILAILDADRKKYEEKNNKKGVIDYESSSTWSY